MKAATTMNPATVKTASVSKELSASSIRSILLGFEENGDCRFQTVIPE
jgi:hypothetical protein